MNDTSYAIILFDLREEFLQRISKKTGWGKNQIIEEFDLSLAKIREQMKAEAKKCK